MAKAGGNPRTIPEGKQQVNFNTESETVFKLKYIALIQGVPVSQVYTQAFQSFADQYEKENGKIKLPKK